MRSTTSLIGTTASNSPTLYPSSFTSLSLNNTAANVALGLELINNQQRYLLQKYFSNEASYSITTIGGTSITLTASPAINSVSATLAFAWPYQSVNALVPFSDGEQRTVSFTNNSTAITWQGGIQGSKFYTTNTISAGATTATLLTPWVASTGSYLIQFSDGETKTVTLTANSSALSWSGGLSGSVQAYFNTSIIATTATVGGIQEYRLPPDYSKLKTETLTIGSLKWTPREILTREEWDNLNVFPYYADIPSNYFIYNNKFQIWPIPATTGNVITFNYKRRIPDLSLADYSTGNVSVSNGGLTVTGSGTTWVLTMNSVSESRYIQFAQPTGDNLWYQIQSVDSTTSLTLMQPYQGVTIASSTTYVIGQMPIIMEDFHDMLVYGALMVYFSSIVSDAEKYKQFKALYDERLELLAEYAGSKTIHVNLGRKANMMNPNLFQNNINN